jgi:hypothetical protein
MGTLRFCCAQLKRGRLGMSLAGGSGLAGRRLGLAGKGLGKRELGGRMLREKELGAMGVAGEGLGDGDPKWTGLGSGDDGGLINLAPGSGSATGGTYIRGMPPRI